MNWTYCMLKMASVGVKRTVLSCDDMMDWYADWCGELQHIYDLCRKICDRKKDKMLHKDNSTFFEHIELEGVEPWILKNSKLFIDDVWYCFGILLPLYAQSTKDIVFIYGDIYVSEGSGMSKLKKSFFGYKTQISINTFWQIRSLCRDYLVMSPDGQRVSIYV